MLVILTGCFLFAWREKNTLGFKTPFFGFLYGFNFKTILICSKHLFIIFQFHYPFFMWPNFLFDYFCLQINGVKVFLFFFLIFLVEWIKKSQQKKHSIPFHVTFAIALILSRFTIFTKHLCVLYTIHSIGKIWNETKRYIAQTNSVSHGNLFIFHIQRLQSPFRLW